MENPRIKSENGEEKSEDGLFVIQGIKIEEDEQNPVDIKLELEENDLHEEDVFSLKARTEENYDSSSFTGEKFQLGKARHEIKSVIQNFDEEIEENKDVKLETFNFDVMREYQEYGKGSAPAENNTSRCQRLIAKESPEEAAFRLADAIAKGPGTAEWKALPWRQRLMAKNAREKAERVALRHAKAAAKKQSSHQSKCAQQLPEEQLIRLVQQATGTPEEDALRGTVVAATADSNMPWGQRLISEETLQVTALRRVEVAAKEPATKGRQIPWRQRLLAKKALEKAALQRIEAAAKEPSTTERKIPWRQRLIAKEALENDALQRIEAAANKQPTKERKIPWRQRLVAKETPEEAALRRAKAAAQKQRSRQNILARQTSEERESQRLQDVSRIQQIRLRQQAKETLEEAAVRRAKEVAQKQRSRKCKRARQSLEWQESQRLQDVSRIPQTRLIKEGTGTLEEAALQCAEADAKKHHSAELHHSAISTHDSFNESQVPAHDCDMMNTECQICHSITNPDEKLVDTTFKNSCHKGAVSNEKQVQEALQFPVDLKGLLSQGFSNLLNTWNP